MIIKCGLSEFSYRNPHPSLSQCQPVPSGVTLSTVTVYSVFVDQTHIAGTIKCGHTDISIYSPTS